MNVFFGWDKYSKFRSSIDKIISDLTKGSWDSVKTDYTRLLKTPGFPGFVKLAPDVYSSYTAMKEFEYNLEIAPIFISSGFDLKNEFLTKYPELENTIMTIWGNASTLQKEALKKFPRMNRLSIKDYRDLLLIYDFKLILDTNHDFNKLYDEYSALIDRDLSQVVYRILENLFEEYLSKIDKLKEELQRDPSIYPEYIKKYPGLRIPFNDVTRRRRTNFGNNRLLSDLKVLKKISF
jgi:hypothetical protein